MSAIEQLRKKADSLSGTGGGEALAAVLVACEALEAHRGRLDQNNRVLAALAFIQTISRVSQVYDVIESLAAMLEQPGDEEA